MLFIFVNYQLKLYFARHDVGAVQVSFKLHLSIAFVVTRNEQAVIVGHWKKVMLRSSVN